MGTHSERVTGRSGNLGILKATSKKYYLFHFTGATMSTGGICFHTTGNHFSALRYV